MTCINQGDRTDVIEGLEEGTTISVATSIIGGKVTGNIWIVDGFEREMDWSGNREQMLAVAAAITAAAKRIPEEP